jgi:hypothetical protein
MAGAAKARPTLVEAPKPAIVAPTPAAAPPRPQPPPQVSRLGISWPGISVTPPRFNLPGGRMQMMGIAQVWGTATLQAVAPDGTTLLNVTGGNLTANSYVIFETAPGLFQLTLTGVTNLFGSILQIPLNPAN